jgi:hypothetical protein
MPILFPLVFCLLPILLAQVFAAEGHFYHSGITPRLSFDRRFAVSNKSEWVDPETEDYLQFKLNKRQGCSEGTTSCPGKLGVHQQYTAAQPPQSFYQNFLITS